MTSYAAIIRSYKADAERREDEDAWWSDRSLNFQQVIRRASLSEIPGKNRLIRYGHQCRLPRAVLVETADLLSSLEVAIEQTSSFDELYNFVSNVCSTIHGAGDLYAYDVAQRIGIRLGLLPERIYLHTGVKLGAKALGIPVAGRKSIEIDELPPALRSLTATEAEDVLCIYKSHFGRVDTEISEVRGCSPSRARPNRC